MAIQTQLGKAFKYVCLMELYNKLSTNQEVIINENNTLDTAKSFYDNINELEKLKMQKGAQAAFRIISRLEPQLENADDNKPLFLSLQEDSQGIKGDVRDVLCIRKQNQWEIGLSCKHNHTAVKHSRLSYTIDFGKLWFGKQCTDQYFHEIKPLFDELTELKNQNKKWSDIKDKSEKYYKPILNSFISEIKRLDEEYEQQIPAALLKYMLGRNDFYKVITNDSKRFTTIQAFNIFGSLNKHTKDVKPENRVQLLKMPSKILDISYKVNSKNTIIITCDNSWSISFRIHSASTIVESSLKFDVQLLGIPTYLHTQIEPWD
ncbi:MAG: HaeIII family restriction endonuclease [Eubacteriales bacterium]